MNKIYNMNNKNQHHFIEQHNYNVNSCLNLVAFKLCQ